MLQDAVAVDDNGNLVQQVDLQLYCATNCAEDIAWFVIKVTMLTMTMNLQNIPEEAAPTVDNEGLFPSQQWGVQHHVDPMEIHGSKKDPEFKDNFDPTEV